MKRTYVIKQNHEFRRLYHRGKSAANRYLVLYCLKNRLGRNRLGLTVSAKDGGAVQRNRAKRLFREAYRLHQDEFKVGFDFVLVARARMLDASCGDVEKALLKAARDLRVLAPKEGETS